MAFFPKVAEVRQSQAAASAEPIERDEAHGILPGERGTPVSLPGCALDFERVAVAFDQFLVYRVGFIGSLRVLHRYQAMAGEHPDVAESLIAPHRVAARDRLLWGLEFGDGRRGYGVRLAGADSDFAIRPRGGGGDGALSVYHYWVHAVPAGGMTFHVAWPALGVPESSVTVPAAPLAEAARIATRVTGWS